MRARGSDIRYSAFISYSHRDSSAGDWLHRKLEFYALPKRLRAARPDLAKTLYPIFRDREELPGSSDLGQNLSDALSHSSNLLVICSPNSAASQWVNQEVVSYQELCPGSPIVAVVIAGQDDSRDKDDFCLPPEIQRLRETEDPVLKIVDARDNGQSKPVLLQLIAQLADLPLSDLQREDKKTTRIRIGTAGATAVALIGVVIGVLSFIQSADLEKFEAESNRYAAIAEEASARGDQSQAIQAALAALPKDLENPERPFSNRAAAALRIAINRPVQRILRTRLTTQPVDILPTSNPQHWQIRDSQHQYHLFDAKKNTIVWTRSFGTVLHDAVNSSDQLVVRTKDSLVTVAINEGTEVCRVKLTSHVAKPPGGSPEWLQKDWAIEWGYQDPEADFKFVNAITFINTSTCKADDPFPYGGVSTGIYLVDVLSDGTKITAVETYNSKDKQNYLVFARWPADRTKPPKALFPVPGRVKGLIPGTFNSDQYEGPVLLTDPQGHVSYIALRPRGSTKFELVTIDWATIKPVRRTTLPGRPLSLKWANRKREELLLKVAGTDAVSNITQIYNADSGALIQENPSSKNISGQSDLATLGPDLSFQLARRDQGTLVANLSAKTAMTIAPPSGELPASVGLGWIDETTAIEVFGNGQISALHVDGLKNVKRLIEANAISRFWTGANVGRHLLLTWSGKFYRVGQGKTELAFEQNQKTRKKFHGPFDDRFLVTTETVDGAEKLELIDLERKAVTFRKSLPSSGHLLSVDPDHLFYRNASGQAVLVRYEIPDAPITLPDKDFQAAALSKDGQSILTVFLKDQFTKEPKLFIRTSSLRNQPEKQSSDLVGPKNSLLTTYSFSTSDNLLFMIQNSVSANGKLSKVSTIDLDSFTQSEIGTFDLSALNAQLGLNFDDVTWKHGFLQLSADGLFNSAADVLIDQKNRRAISFDTNAGRRLLLGGDLLMHGQVLVFQDNLVKLMTLESQTVQELRCDFLDTNPEATLLRYFHEDDIFFIASTRRVCAVKRSTGNILFDAPLPRDLSTVANGSDVLNSTVAVALIRRREAGYTLVLESGLAYEIDFDKDWKALVRQAREYGLDALNTSSNGTLGQ